MKVNVKLKLQIGFGVILLFLLIISGIGMYYLKENNDTLALIEKEQKTVALYNDIAFQAVRANAAIRGYMLYEHEEMKKNHYEIRDELYTSLEALKNSGEQSAEFTNYLTQLTEWENGIDQEILPLLASDPAKANEVALPILGEGSRLLVSFGKKMANEVTLEIESMIDATEQNSQNKLFTMGILSVLAILISFTISSIFGSRIAKNIREVVEKMSTFSSGDFLTKLNLKSNDEFGQLSNSFNMMTETLRKTMIEVSNSSEQVAATAEELTASSNEVSYATEVVTESIQDISQGVDQQSQMTNDVNKLSENVMSKMHDITTNIESVNQSATTTKELADQGQKSVENIMEQMDMIAQNTDLLTSDVKELDANTSMIARAVDVIKGIAEQTNLLAINASIEAARSGIHGKGFAVVATEVRNLADESNRAAIEIESMVRTITTHTEKIVEEIVVNEQSVMTGKERVDVASHSFSTIDHAIEEVQKQTEAVTMAIHQIHGEIGELVKGIDQIHLVASQSNDHVQSVAASSEEQMASMEEVAAASTHLSQMAIRLQENIQTFKY